MIPEKKPRCPICFKLIRTDQPAVNWSNGQTTHAKCKPGSEQ